MKKLVQNGILISIALVLSLAEKWFPLGLVVPLPGIKLGLANVVTMFALFYSGWKSAFIIAAIRSILASLFYGGIISLALSLAGGLLALLIMVIMKKRYGKWFSLIGVSIGGAVAHNVGQVAMAALIMKSPAVFYYLAVLLVTGVITGVLTGTVALYLFEKLRRIGFFKDSLA